MATVFMKWLETSPRDYDRGIQLLTLGRIRQLKQRIVDEYVRPGLRILEIGCGTGELTALMAEREATVTAIDASPAMLHEAEGKIKQQLLGDRVTLHYMDAALIGEQFPEASFDLIVSTLVFSELPQDQQRYVLEACRKLLAAGGQLLIADEVVPGRGLTKLPFYLVRLPLVVLTWLLTRTTTNALQDFKAELRQAGLAAIPVASYLAGSLVLYQATPAEALETAPQPPAELAANVVGRLKHRVTLGSLLSDLWLLLFRIIPPYPKQRTGLYAVGNPGRRSPVLVTGNFVLTVRRLVKAIDGKLDAWLLIADSSGINVWCAAGGGYFTAEKVIAAVKTARLEQVVDHHALILPQLCANGVDGWRVRQATGWGVHWGPPRAEDLPAYLAAKRKKTDRMRWVRFPLKDRLEMVTVTLGMYGLLILIPLLLFFRPLFWPIAISLFALSYFYAVLLPWIPGRDGLFKSIPLALMALAGLFVYRTLWDPLPSLRLFHWSIGLVGLSVFVAAELQGMSPRMRGEQANWSWEAVIGLGLGAIYWLIPLAVGWQ